MKQKARRVFSVFLALIMLVSLVGTGMTVASAEENYQQTNDYVLNYSGESISGYEDYDAKRLFASPYRTDIFVTEEDGISNWNWCSASVLNMINTTKLGSGGEGAYASIGVYCVDAVTDGVTGYYYRRMNLEDAGYFSRETAGRVRAILLASFPYQQDMEMLATQVNAWIDAEGNGLAKVEQLNASEAISATQSVIWSLTNAGRLNDEIYAGYYPSGFPDAQIVYPESMDYKESEFTAGNIQALALYLDSLAPVSAKTRVISASAFSNADVRFEQQADGTYTATVTVTVSAEITGETALQLVAVAEGKATDAQTVQDGTHVHTLTIEGLKKPCDVTLNIDGRQDGSDVFLFAPANGREASQTMAGFDNSVLPAHAEMTIKTDRVFHILKTDKEGMPLENISFDIFRVCDRDDYVNGRVSIGAIPTEADVENYAVDSNRVATVTTGKDGKATWNSGNEDGVYLVVELPNTVIASPVDPFFLVLPAGDSEDPQYVVTARPKNTVIEEDVKIEKDVTEIDNDWSTYDVNTDHTWIIRTTIPAGIATGQKFEITDTLDYRLTYRGNLKVTVHEKTALSGDSPLLTLEAGVDYVLTVGTDSVTVEAAQYTVDTFKVALTAEGMRKAAAVLGIEPELRVYFDAVINENAQMGLEIPNQAHLEYINNVGKEFETDSDIPEVVTGGLKLIKIDATDASRLSGAQFALYRDAADTEGGVSIMVNGVEKQVALIGELITAADGTAVYKGLAYGTYYLVETKAPEGYNLLTETVTVTVDADSHQEEGSAVTVRNSSKFKLPETGGMGTTVFTASGLAVMGTAAALFVIFGKKRSA